MLQLPEVSPQTELNAKSLVTSREDFLSPFSRRDTETPESESNCRICYVRGEDNWNVIRCFLSATKTAGYGWDWNSLSPLLVSFTPCGKQTCPPPRLAGSAIWKFPDKTSDFIHSGQIMFDAIWRSWLFLIAREVWGISHSRRRHISNAKSDFIS